MHSSTKISEISFHIVSWFNVKKFSALKIAQINIQQGEPK